MWRIIIAIAFVTAFISCSEDIDTPCSEYATVVDMSGLDGCGFVLVADNGKKYEPISRVFRCGTPPFPEEYYSDPTIGFQFYAGQRVSFSYEEALVGTICMSGLPVYLTCLKEVGSISSAP